MKRTELEKRERELKRTQKKADVLERKSSVRGSNVGMFIEDLFKCFLYDQNEIFNTGEDIKILEILEDMKENLPEKQWDNVLRKSIKKTNVSQKDKAFNELKALLD
jgi:hypothetical protein